jgi:diguanylate cyclase (GGDEF)-like protein
LTSNIAIGLGTIVLTGLVIGWAINRFQRRLETMATTDPLTGLHNRQVFDIVLGQAVERARRGRTKLALILVDLDRFKATNDRFGHLNGDKVLRQAALLLRGSVRKADTLARWGGEEFTILMENCGEAEAVKAAEELRRRMADSLAIPEVPEIRTTASFGIAEFSGENSAEGMLSRADKALYKAKELGRNRVVGFTEMSRPEAV